MAAVHQASTLANALGSRFTWLVVVSTVTLEVGAILRRTPVLVVRSAAAAHSQLPPASLASQMETPLSLSALVVRAVNGRSWESVSLPELSFTFTVISKLP